MNIPCNQPCPYNTLRGCIIHERPGKYCPMGNMSKKEYKPLTNGDRIRTMTDEELAIMFAMLRADLSRLDRAVRPYSARDVNGNYDWLKQPAKEDA